MLISWFDLTTEIKQKDLIAINSPLQKAVIVLLDNWSSAAKKKQI